MAYAILTNGIETKKAPIGFSWTSFFFGAFPALFRQDWKWGIWMFIGCFLTYGIAAFVGAFFYNKVYIKALLHKGWKVKALAGSTVDEFRAYTEFLEVPTTDDFTVVPA
jgi:hypothetical protein